MNLSILDPDSLGFYQYFIHFMGIKNNILYVFDVNRISLKRWWKMVAICQVNWYVSAKSLALTFNSMIRLCRGRAKNG